MIRRTMDRPHSIGGLGTSEAAWRAWPALREFPALHLTGTQSAVVVAPYPDDAVFGFGGGLAILADAGARLRIVAVSEGEARLCPGPRTPSPVEEPRHRHSATLQALEVLGASDIEMVRLGRDAGPGACGVDELAARLAEACADFQVCVAPWEGDRHPEHETAGSAARRAAARTGAALLGYPVWLWNWAVPEDPRVPWRAAHRIVLPEEARGAKAAAVAFLLHRLHPPVRHVRREVVLTSTMTAHFARESELVFV
ncbi:PIG-L deacetylase family protein [Marinitenerispora sediminis]|nr:PIG-L family deacetylase [Marinitenerispora sediminis]RCV49792.1 PIG-L family deacetylase [Marinitenerispora sediminis]RCV50208.1 PIG-L family deacetylase [Marinitenerispora sediminis]